MLAVSKASLATLEKLRPKVAKRLLYNGTPMREVSAEDARRARAELGIREGEVLFGVFGRLQRWKGQDVFVEAAAEVARGGPGTVRGRRGLGLRPGTRVLRRAQATGRRAESSERLIFTGFRKDVPSLMAACDVVCHTTRWRTVRWSSSRRWSWPARDRDPGRRSGGIIASESEGILVEPDDARALATAMGSLVDDADRRGFIGANGARRARDHFSIDRMVSELIGHLEGELAK